MRAFLEALLRGLAPEPAQPIGRVRENGRVLGTITDMSVDLPPLVPAIYPQQLSENFALAEFTASDIAARKGIDNAAPDWALPRLRKVALQMERVRALLGGKPIVISSGYRCPLLNTVVGGSPSSAHCDGWALDFTCPGFGTPLQICKAIEKDEATFSNVDQLIHEFGRWVHISFDPRNRAQAFTIFRKPRVGVVTVPGLKEVH